MGSLRRHHGPLKVRCHKQRTDARLGLSLGGLMITRIDAARVRACFTLAFTLALLAFAGSAQAAAPDFTWSSTVSTAQAGGHPNLTFNYASSSTQSLTRLDVDLPQGFMHRNYLTGAC